MALSSTQFQELLNEYDHIRGTHHMEEANRKETVYRVVPEIRQIDEQIAHISVEKGKQMILHPETDLRESLRKEIYELSMEKINLLAVHHFPSDYLDPIYDCPLCKDTGYVGSEKCTCLKQRIMNILYDQSNIKELLQKENFSNFCLEYYNPNLQDGHTVSSRDNMTEILGKSHEFIEHFNDIPAQNLLIYGNAGVGKTYLTNCIAGELLRQGKSVIYLTAYQLFEQLADYAFRRNQGNADTLPFLLQCDLLIIDDLGTELNNAFINSQLFLCVNERILHNKATIISTNLSLKEINRIYTERVFSRLIQSYTLFHIWGDDIRIKKAFTAK